MEVFVLVQCLTQWYFGNTVKINWSWQYFRAHSFVKRYFELEQCACSFSDRSEMT